MFKFLKEKLKNAISKISEGVEKEGRVEEKVVEKPVEEEKGFFAKLKEKFVGKEEETEVKKESKQVIEPKPEITGKETEKKGFFEAIKEKIITTKINEQQFEKLFWDLELALMENNVAVEVIEKIKNDLKEELVEKPIKRTRVEETVQETLKLSLIHI